MQQQNKNHGQPGMIRFLTALFAVLMLASCAAETKFRTYTGPEVTQVIVSKSERQMHLLHHDRVLKTFPIDLGFAPQGHKHFEGDGRTPEGDYFIDRRNPNSSFHLSIGISYPNAADRAFARAHGKHPGGDIFIHGFPNGATPTRRDWTAGCIAVTNAEMEKIYAMVRDGTPIRINP